MDTIIKLLVLVFSVVAHEVAHGVVAEKFGDDTAKRAGRLTLNPLPHIDPFASVILPLLLFSSGSPVILGAAKPVPVDFSNMRRPKLGMAVVSLAGPFTNFFLAILAMLILKFNLSGSDLGATVMFQLALTNIVLGIFNILPIPPLDGSKVLVSLANREWIERLLSVEKWGFLIIILFAATGLLGVIISPLVRWSFSLFGLV